MDASDVTTAPAIEAHDLADEQESYRRYQLAEREMLDALDDEELDDAARKRRMMRVFDRFRYEYTQLSTLLREHVRAQRRIMDKCLEMKNELVFAALKIKTNQHVQDEEMKNLVFYRDECELAWKERNLSEERERDAMRIIDDLKREIEELQSQVKALVATALPPTSAVSVKERGGVVTVNTSVRVSSPSKTVAALKKHSSGASRAMTTSSHSFALAHDAVPSFDEWKRATRVWDPHVVSIAPRTATPSIDALLALEKQQEIARCVSVPSLQPTAMERAATATAALPHTPSRTRTSRTAPSAVGFLRATTPSTPVSPTRRTIAPLPRV